LSTLAETIELIQPACFYKLLSEAWFNNIAIWMVREKRIDSQTLNSLKGLGGIVRADGKQTKGGATIEVLMPELDNGLPDSPGPTSTVNQVFLVKTMDLVNLGAYGVGLSCEQIAGQIAQTFHDFVLGVPRMGSLYAAQSFYRRIHSGFEDNGDLKPFVTLEVTLNATLVPDAIAQTAQPAISAPEQTVTLTDEQPGGGSAIYYTTDGSFPGPGNAAATLYTIPFTVSSGTPVCAASYYAGLAGSNVHAAVIN
jgi:hypothetical protein